MRGGITNDRFTVGRFTVHGWKSMKINRFEDVEAWQLARELTRMVYRLTKKQAFGRDYGLKRQIQEAAGSAMHVSREEIAKIRSPLASLKPSKNRRATLKEQRVP